MNNLTRLTLALALATVTLDNRAKAEDSSAAASAKAEELNRRSIERRAVEAVIWGMPAVNYERMLQAAFDNGAKLNQVVYWSRPGNWKNQTLTPNPDTIYLNPFYDTSKGPVVVEIPPADADHVIVGSFDVAWQNAPADVGPAGADKGKGARYLITPPGYKENAPEGYIVLPSETYRGFVILRSNFKSRSDADIKSAVEHGKRVKVYPLGGNPDSTVFVDAYDKPFDATIPYDATFFELLDRFVQTEPWLTRDKVMIDTLKTTGIEKGKPFKPDAKTRAILDKAAQEAHEVIALKYETGFVPPFFEGTHWGVPIPKETRDGLGSMFADPNEYGVDGRAVMYHMAYFSPKIFGGGQFYLLNIVDRTGKPLEGNKTYRLTVPPNAPVEQYWSATAYDREMHSLVRGMSRPSLASNDSAVQKNPDGSVDVYFGPSAPAGKESNWVPTDPEAAVISARNLKVEEAWTPEPGKAKAGDAFTRTITFTAPEVPAMAFPPFPVEKIEGLGIYPKPPEGLDENNRGNLIGKRRDTITYVCQRPGEFTIPAVRLSWFDLDAQKLQTIDFPARQLIVSANPALSSTATKKEDFVPWTTLVWLLGAAAVVLLVTLCRGYWMPWITRALANWRPVHLQPLNPSSARIIERSIHVPSIISGASISTR